MTANEITATLLIEIPKRWPHVHVRRNNRLEATAIGKGGRKRHISAGIDGQGDIMGIIGPRGRHLEIEVKAGRDRIRVSQHAYRAMCESLGALYVVAHDVDGCLAELDGIL